MKSRKFTIFLAILLTALAFGHRVQSLRREGITAVNNIVRIQEKNGIPHDYITVERKTDVLTEPLYVKNGRAFVSKGRVRKFSVGQKIQGTSAKIVSVSKTLNLDTGMFVITVSPAISGNVMVEKEYTGFFVPLDAEIPDNVKVIAKDSERMVVSGLTDGDKVVVR